MGSIEALSQQGHGAVAIPALSIGNDAWCRHVEWNATSHVVPDVTLVDLLEASAARTPDATALLSGRSRLTYAQLHRRADRLASTLVLDGVGPECIIAVALPRSVELVVALLAVLKAGAAYLPLDVDYPLERLAFMLKDACPTALITNTTLQGRFPVDVPLVFLEEEGDDDRSNDHDAPHRCGEHRSTPRLTPAHPAYVIYTSGSTGIPKGVVNTHRALVNRLQWMQATYPIDASDIILQKTPCSFDVSVWEFFWPLLQGATLLLARPDGHRDPVYLAELVRTHGVTTMHFVPSMLQIFLDTPTASLCSSLRRVICSGEALSRTLQKRFHQVFPCSLHNLYGPTEAAIDVTAWTCQASDDAPAVPIGRPIWNTRVYVLDVDLKPQPAGSPGELYLAGTGLARGYLGRPSLTAERFIADPFGAPGDRMYRTGDLACWRSDGVVEYLGRLDQQVKLRGYRIEPGEIESCLLACEGVREALVTVAPDPSGDLRLIGYVIPSASHALPVVNMLSADEASHAAGEPGRTHRLPNGLTVFHQNPVETRFVYEEIFAQKIYLRHGIHLRDGDCVIDVGANIGLFSLFVAQRWPNATVHSFEPIPPVFESLKKNVSRYRVNGAVHACGLSDRAGQATFRFYPNDTVISSSSTTETETRDLVKSYLRNQSSGGENAPDEDELERLLDSRLQYESFTCRLRRLSDVIAEHAIERIDLLKIDVENAEHAVLAGIDDADWARIEQVVVEVHDIDGRLDEIRSLLSARGFAIQIEQESQLHATAIYNLYASRFTRVVEIVPAVTRCDWTWTDAESLSVHLRSELSRRLPEYMVPNAIVILGAFPLMPNGKLDRSGLPAPDSRANAIRPYEAAKDGTEVAIATLWQGLLGLERVGRNDHFFELGGHSLMASRVLARIQRDHGVDLPLQALFDAPVLSDFAQRVISSRKDDALVALAPVRLGQKQAPLSYSQEMLFLEDQLNPALLSYNVPESFRITGVLDVRALEWALSELVRRQESLRTRYVRRGDDIVQVVDPPARLQPLPIFDLTGCSHAGDREDRVRQLQMHAARGTFSLENGPILRAIVIQCDDEDYRLLLVVHHIATDGWGQSILRRELGALYRSFGGASALAEAPIQYTDYALWQRQALSTAVLAEGLAYWRRQLRGVKGDVGFPADRLRPAGRSSRGAREPFGLDRDMSQTVKRFCKRCEVTPFMLLLSVLKILLQRITAETDIVVGTAFSDRSEIETESLVGNLTNTVALRSDLAGGPSFREVLGRVARTTLEAHRYRNIPFQNVVQQSGGERILDRNPFFQVSFVLENTPDDPLDLGSQLGVESELLDIGTCIDHFGLTLKEESGVFTGYVEYSADLYEPATIRGFMDSYTALLRAAIDGPDQSIANLTLLSPRQAAQMLDWGRGKQNDDGAGLAVTRFEREVMVRGGATAVVCDDGTLTYAELNGRANQLARHLETMGVGPEVAVGVLLERTVDLYVALLGIMKAGGIYVPLDPTYPSDRLAHMAIDAAVGVVLTGQGEAHLVSGGPWKTIDIRAFHDAFSLYAEDNLPTRLLPENLAYIMYTSGSTGKPKGVGISHSALTNQMQWCANAFGINATDRFLHKASIGFDSSIEEILCPLTCGARIVASRPRGEYDLEYLAALIEREAVTCVDLAPSLLAALMDVTPTQGWLSVRLVISGGEALKPDLADAFKARCPAVLANTYGPTETTVQCAWTTDLGAEKRVAIGRPVANTQLYVLDAYMQPVPMGAHGELYVGGTGVARGYLNRAGATADAFLPDPFSTKGERLYRTGDQVLWRSDGQLEFLGRMDHQVKLRGYRIELAEVEQSIEAIAGVKHAVAAIRDDGRGEPALAAYVVAEERLDTNELRDALRSRLPRHMVPTYWMQLSQLPLNANGKIDRRQLPELDANMASADYTSPRNSLESVICAVFQDLLQSERIGVHDNFFDLGGHSLSATRAMTRLSTTLNASLPVRLLFEAPTPAQLARATGLPMCRTDDIDPESSDEEHPSAETERMLASLETLSEDEVELLLAQLSGEV